MKTNRASSNGSTSNGWGGWLAGWRAEQAASSRQASFPHLSPSLPSFLPRTCSIRPNSSLITTKPSLNERTERREREREERRKGNLDSHSGRRLNLLLLFLLPPPSSLLPRQMIAWALSRRTNERRKSRREERREEDSPLFSIWVGWARFSEDPPLIPPA